MSTNPLLEDTCIYMEANKGDGGIHNATGTWWLSPDVDVAERNDAGEVPPNKKNAVTVRFHKKTPECSFGGEPDAINFEAYVAIPSAVIAPTNENQVKKIGSNNISVKDVEQGYEHEFPWTPGTDPAKPDGPGHRCLVARCWPDNLTASYNNMFLPDDPHSAQHNIVIAQVPTGGGAGGGKIKVIVATANPDKEQSELVTLTVTAVLNPQPSFLKYLTKQMTQIKNFSKFALLEPGHIKRLLTVGNEAMVTQVASQVIPQRFSLELPDFPEAKIYDFSRPKRFYDNGGRLISHRFLARFTLQPEQLTSFPVIADLSQSQPGNTHIFNVRHIGSDKKVKGGLTIVAVVT